MHVELAKSVHAGAVWERVKEERESTNEIYSSMNVHEFPVDFDPTSGIYVFVCVHKRGK